MELPNPLSPRANAFSIASIMSGPLDAMFLAGAYPSSAVPPQRSTDCFFDWNHQAAAAAAAASSGHYGPAAMKGMEGERWWRWRWGWGAGMSDGELTAHTQ